MEVYWFADHQVDTKYKALAEAVRREHEKAARVAPFAPIGGSELPEKKRHKWRRVDPLPLEGVAAEAAVADNTKAGWLAWCWPPYCWNFLWSHGNLLLNLFFFFKIKTIEAKNGPKFELSQRGMQKVSAKWWHWDCKNMRPKKMVE